MSSRSMGNSFSKELDDVREDDTQVYPPASHVRAGTHELTHVCVPLSSTCITTFGYNPA